jgi:two-component system NtrC family sensor kinase
MKKIFICIVWLLSAVVAHAQQTRVDSLKSRLKNETADSSKTTLLIQLSREYYLEKPDVGLSYASQALAITKKTGNKKAEAHALTQIGFSVWLLGNRPVALQTFVNSLKISRELNDQWNIARNYDGMSVVYAEQGEIKTAIEYGYKAEAIFRQLGDYQNVVDELMDIEDFYQFAGKLDSSLTAARKALQLSVKINEHKWRAQILGTMGDVYFKLHKNSVGLAYLYQSIAIAQHYNQPLNLLSAYLPLANTYLTLGKRDSSIFFAKKMFDLARSRSFSLPLVQASSLLAKLYYGNNDHESAQYYKIATSLQDSLFNAEKAKQVLIINITEQQHEADLKNAAIAYQNKMTLYGVLIALLLVTVILFILWVSNKRQHKANRLLERQKKQVQQTLDELKSTQTRLIQSEKMASLGELTAGIAHEIQNPLNFVNNFSEVNAELIDEMKNEIRNGNLEDGLVIADDIKENEQKISMHGKRADSIVKSMLEHSRASSGQKELTDLNALADEYMRLSYHGLRAKDKTFNSAMETHFGSDLPKANVIPQDIGRVLLNLFNNAFYAVHQKKKQNPQGYLPQVTLTTLNKNGFIEITVKDNGNGIPDNIKDKIMQPFFTTKPTGEGTGLGLSLSYDIVVKGHGGSITVNSKKEEGSEFTIILPV